MKLPDGHIDARLAGLKREIQIQRIAELLFMRFLVDLDDGRKAAGVILDMIQKEQGRGNG